MSSSNLADMSIKITTVLNRHLAENPSCLHNIRDIVKEVFSQEFEALGPAKAPTTNSTADTTNPAGGNVT